MKRALAIGVILAVIIGAGTLIGLNHSSSSIPPAELNQKLLLAEKFIDNGDADKALGVFEEMESKGQEWGPSGEAVRLAALNRAGQHEAVSSGAEAFLENYPDSKEKTRVELVRLTSELATSGLGNSSLRQSVEKFLSNNPDHAGAIKLHIALAEQEISLGDYGSAQRRLSRIIASTEDDAAVLRLAEPLGRANLEKLYSPALGEADFTYTVQRGDTINGIANEYDITEELLMRCNNIDDPRKLRVGQRLKVPNVDFSLTVDVAANTLMLKNHGEIFKIYPVRTGREPGSTPTGQFKIINKKTNPTWRPGNGYKYLPGDPNNELGTRWMAFQGDLYGIHGTVHPDTVGQYASNGCVGMKMDEVEELFNLITVGTPLEIKGEQDLERHDRVPEPNVPPPQQVARN